MAEIIKDMSDKDYFAIDALNASTIKGMSNPQKVKHDKDNPKEPTEAMRLGTAYHALLLQGIKPVSESEGAEISPYDAYRTKEAKTWRDEKLEKGIKILKEKEAAEMDRENEILTNKLFEMQEPLLELDGVTEYLDNAWRESVVLWDKIMPDRSIIKCKAKLDMYREDSDYLIDVKTCGNIAKFDSSARDFGYYIQALWYAEAVAQLDGKIRPMQFAVIGTAKPYQAILRKCPDKLLELGRSEINVYTEMWQQCKEADVWPSPYSTECEEIVVPGYFYNQKGLDYE